MYLLLVMLISLISINAQIIKCHSFGLVQENSEELKWEKCDEQFIISPEFKSAFYIEYDKNKAVASNETMEYFDEEEIDGSIIFTLKHSDSSEFKFTELELYLCTDCKEGEIMIMATITKDDDSEFVFYYKAYWWDIAKFKE